MKARSIMTTDNDLKSKSTARVRGEKRFQCCWISSPREDRHLVSSARCHHNDKITTTTTTTTTATRTTTITTTTMHEFKHPPGAWGRSSWQPHRWPQDQTFLPCWLVEGGENLDDDLPSQKSVAWLKNTIPFKVLPGGLVELPQPLPQPSGCRADTQIVCPGSGHRICQVQKCDGTEDCPKVETRDSNNISFFSGRWYRCRGQHEDRKDHSAW